MVGLEGFEPPTHGLGNRCSIRLSYRPLFFIDLTQCQVEICLSLETVARFVLSPKAASNFSIASGISVRSAMT